MLEDKPVNVPKKGESAESFHKSPRSQAIPDFPPWLNGVQPQFSQIVKRVIYALIRLARQAWRTGTKAFARRNPAKPKRVVLLVVATNKYLRFVEPLLASADRYFLPGHSYEVLLFTNLDHSVECRKLADERAGRARGKVHLKHIEHSPWPMMTLLRYRFFTQAAKAILGYDYAFYSDCDMRFVAEVGEEILGEGLTAVRHCGFHDKGRALFTYETRPESRAYIPSGEGLHYFAGGFQGGRSAAYVQAAADCSKQIDDDLSREITAIWHDESHWNALLWRHPHGLTILDPGYCMGERMRTPYPSMILALDKNHSEIRSEG
jgi:histo-blood group ABO system transferase